MYDHNLTFRSSGQDENIIKEGGDQLLNYRDLRITLGINTKGRKPSCNDLVPKVKKRNWLAFYHEKNAVTYLGRVIEIGVVEHWIYDIGVNKISPSVQLPIIKKYSGCDLKEIHTKSKRKSVKQRCLLIINDTNRSIKINAKSINDRYILDISVFECLAQAENNSITKLVDNVTDQTPSNLLTFIHLPSVRNKLLKIKDSLEFVKNIKTYTDRLFKKYSLISVEIGSAFLISSPKSLN
ncbi:unnamed protein product [Rhizophagus irregularis]|nr:unnamed protein product [Rhizophagus irregularis]